MNIRIGSARNVAIQLIFVPPGESFSSAQVENLSQGKTKVIPKIEAGQDWWVMYEPRKLKAGQIRVESWVTLESIPQNEKDAILKKEAE